MIDKWRLEAYKPLALEMCYRTDSNPYELVCTTSGHYVEYWEHYALKLLEHNMMQEVLRMHGPYGQT